MRSWREIWFRIRQECANLALLVHPPDPGTLAPGGALKRLSLTYAVDDAEIEAIARRVLQHRFPLLGIEIETGPEIDWRRDYVHGVSSGTPYFRFSPYLDFARVGDHKLIWELNRHQHLVLLAQAYHLTGEREFLDEVFRQLESWLDANPFLRGINWASALEVGFRALSWTWLWLLAGDLFPPPLARRSQTALYRHGCYLERNLSVYFSPNTHLLGEAVALHALGALFPSWPRADRWTALGGQLVREQMKRQVRPDGSHFEQSAYYHVYALDFFLLHRALAGSAVGDAYDAQLQKMAEYLDALMGPSGILPYLGDDDGGRVFHPYGERAFFGRATLARCAVPQRESHSQSRLFPDAGVAVMVSGECQIVVKAGPFAEGSAGHSHSDVLSLVARIGPREILIDPGTYTYVADPQERNRFRSSAAHNTLAIDGRDQAIPAGPFRWEEKPSVAIREWATSDQEDYLDATCTYAGFTHRRQIRFVKPGYLIVLDTVDGLAGPHLLEQFWHLESAEDIARLAFTAPAENITGWRSSALYRREPVPVLGITYRGVLPAQMAALLDLCGRPEPRELRLITGAGKPRVTWDHGSAEF